MSLQPISEFPPPQPKRRLPKEKVPTANVEFRSEESFEESVPESKRHLEARTTLYLVLRKAYGQALSSQGSSHESSPGNKDDLPLNIAIGSEQFVYFDAKDATKCFSPDGFVKLDSSERDFDKWLVWEQGVLDLVVEIVSGSDRGTNVWDEKFAKYQTSGVREVVRFDSTEREAITVWDRVGTKLVERRRNGLTAYECKTLGLYWTVETNPTYGPQLRLAQDRECKQLLPTPDEGELRMAQELADERRARALAEHEKRLAEHEKMLAEQKQRDAEGKRLEAERKQRATDKKRREESKARVVAEQKHRDEAQARLRLEAENEQLRAELEKLRSGSR